MIIMTDVLNFQELNGRNIRVSFANDRPAGPRSYGGGGGGGGYRGDRGFGGGDAFWAVAAFASMSSACFSC